MAVRPENLENPERAMDLSTREDDPKGRKREDPAAAELKALRERIEAVKAEPPLARYPEPACRACFVSGWAAAVKALEE